MPKVWRRSQVGDRLILKIDSMFVKRGWDNLETMQKVLEAAPDEQAFKNAVYCLSPMPKWAKRALAQDSPQADNRHQRGQ